MRITNKHIYKYKTASDEELYFEKIDKRNSEYLWKPVKRLFGIFWIKKGKRRNFWLDDYGFTKI